MELTRLIQHPEEMNKETLYDLRELLALYPYYQTARLLMLQNLYLLHDASFDEELRRAAIYITDRKVIFQMVEAAHYQLKKESHAVADKKEETADRTSDLIDNFLESIPADKEDEEKKKEKRKPTPADAAVDYVAYLLETEGETEEENSSRTISLIDDFMEDGGFKLPKIDVSADYQPEYKPELNDNNKEEQTENSGVFTETLARIYIKQGKYQRALDIIRRLHEKHPGKSMHYADQMRFLEKLIKIINKTSFKMLYTLFVVLIVLVALLMIFIVLIQESKGGGLASNFSSSNAIMGVRKTTDVVEKLTWGLAAAMVIISVACAYVAPTAVGESSVMENSATTEQTALPAMPGANNAAGAQTAAPAKGADAQKAAPAADAQKAAPAVPATPAK